MRRPIFALLLVGAVALAGCKVETTVTVDVHEDGSGVVRVRADLDAEAVRQAETGGAKLEDRIRLADLTAAEWKVAAWKRRPDGSASLLLRKRFESAAQLTGVLDEMNGARGPVHDVRLTRDSNLLSTSYELTGVADLTQLTSGVLDDPEIVARLTAERVDLSALDQRLAQQLQSSFRLRFIVRFPDGTRRVRTIEPGGRSTLDASASELDATRAGLLATGVVLAALAVVILVRGELTGGRRRRRRNISP